MEQKTKARQSTTSTTAAPGNNVPGHPCDRVPDVELDRQVLMFFDRMKICDQKVRY